METELNVTSIKIQSERRCVSRECLNILEGKLMVVLIDGKVFRFSIQEKMIFSICMPL